MYRLLVVFLFFLHLLRRLSIGMLFPRHKCRVLLAVSGYLRCFLTYLRESVNLWILLCKFTLSFEACRDKNLWTVLYEESAPKDAFCHFLALAGTITSSLPCIPRQSSRKLWSWFSCCHLLAYRWRSCWWCAKLCKTSSRCKEWR